jgi:YhcH/YjgK/YiaL family protein
LVSAGQGNAAGDDESRLVEGELKSWRSNPRLKRLEVAFRFLERPDLKVLPVGKHVIDEKAYAMIDKSPSQPPEGVEFEAHRKYIDVHYMISGQVATGYAPIEKLKLHTPYNEKDEAAMYYVPAAYTKVKLYPGMFAVFFPGGGHMPNCHLDGRHDLHKVVVKVRHDYGMK